MAERIVEGTYDHAPEMPDVLERVLVFCLDDAKKQLEEAGAFDPFTATAVKDKLFMESVTGEEPEQCFAQARHIVQGERGASAYGFCYDGYIEVDDGTVDAIIAEGGVPGDLKGYAIGCVYRVAEDGTRTFEDKPTFIGNAPNYMALTNTKTFAEEQAEAEAERTADEAETASDDAESACTANPVEGEAPSEPADSQPEQQGEADGSEGDGGFQE